MPISRRPARLRRAPAGIPCFKFPRRRVDTYAVGAHRDDPAIKAHVASVSARTASDTARLSSVIDSHCWPGGTGDHTKTVALEWVRRWGPHARGALPPACECAVGRCLVCN